MENQMTSERVAQLLNSLGGKTATATDLQGKTLSIEICGEGTSRGVIQLQLSGGWSLLRRGDVVVRSGETYGFESEFESEDSWHTYQAQREVEALVLAELTGKAILSVEVDDTLKRLTLIFSDDYAIVRPAESSANDNWSYTDLATHAGFSVSRDGLRSWSPDLSPREPIARREIFFEKNGEELPGAITLTRPKPENKKSPWDEVSTRVIIDTPFEQTSTGSMGVDGVQSIELSLMVTDVELDRIAAANGATITHLAPNYRTLNPYQDELIEIHNILAPMRHKLLDWTESLETREMSELIKRLEASLDRVEALQSKSSE